MTLLAAGVLIAGCAQDARPVVIDEAWAPATPPNATVAGTYMQIEARSGDTLMGAHTPVAKSVEMHQTSEEGGMMKMRQVDSIAIAPTQTVALAPNGTHFMLTGLHAPLAPGTKFEMTLRFEKSGEVPVEVAVMAPNADHAHH